MASAGMRGAWVLIEMYHLRPRRLLQCKLFITERKIHGELDHGQGNFVFLFGAPYLDTRGEEHRVVILVIAVVRVGNQRPGFVVDKLSIGQKIKTTENDLARKPAVGAAATN